MPAPLLRLLRWSERYTKTDMVYLAQNGLWLTGEQILFGLIAFGLGIAFAHFVSKEVYGTYRYLLSLFWTLAAFSLTGVPVALNRAIARGEEGAYRAAIRLTLLGGLPVTLIASGLSYYYFALGESVLGYGALAIALGTPLFQAGYLYAAFLEGKRDFRRTASFGVVLNLIPALALLAAMRTGATPTTFFAIWIISNIATAGAISWIVFRIYRPSPIASPELANYSGHLSALNILGTIATQLDQLLIFHFLGAADLALYSFATALPDQAKSMVTNLGNIAFPKFVGRPINEIRRTMWQRVLLLTLVVAVGIAAYYALAPWFFGFFFPAYSDAVPYSRLYALTLIAIGSIVPTTALQAHAAKRELYLFNIVSPLVQIATLFAGVWWWGLVGVIAARGATRIFNFFFGLGLVRSYARRAASASA